MKTAGQMRSKNRKWAIRLRRRPGRKRWADSLLEKGYWLRRGRWPTPLGFPDQDRILLFDSKTRAEEWLFQKQVRKNRDVSGFIVVRVRLK